MENVKELVERIIVTGAVPTVPNNIVKNLMYGQDQGQVPPKDWPTNKSNIVASTKEQTVALKYDDGKPDWSLVPFEALEGMVKVLEFGAKKYSGWNWTANGGFKWTRVMRSCFRHLFAWMRGEDNDPESGLSHIYHAQCNLLFIAYYIGNKNKFKNDDRYVR